jgi:4-diphosphocytidyl-2-C-methyl-D-erythritol kinase
VTGWREAAAPAKLNLALVVGPPREDGKHEVLTVLQRLDLGDRVAIEPASSLEVRGFPADTLVRDALAALAAAAGVEPEWRATIVKRIPVAAGLGGGSSDAATALRLANESLAAPLPLAELEALAARLGADVPFFLHDGPQLGRGDGSELEPLDLPQDYWVVLALPHGAHKASTATVYRRFEERGGEQGFDERAAALERVLASVRRPRDLADLPANDLASSPLADELRALGAFRADVTGAGPTVYGLFHHRRLADGARKELAARARTWLAVPAWYG